MSQKQPNTKRFKQTSKKLQGKEIQLPLKGLSQNLVLTNGDHFELFRRQLLRQGTDVKAKEP